MPIGLDDLKLDGPGVLGRLSVAAGQPVSATSLAVVRMVIGAIGAFSAGRLLWLGWADSLYSGPEHRLAYAGMGWVPVLPSAAMRLLVVVMGLAALAVAAGWRYRVATVVFFVAFSWMEFTEASVYLNHYWFVTLVAALMTVLPLHTAWSLDARRERPAGAPRSVPVGMVWLLRAQVGVVYVFAGIAKLHGDWLGHGLPLGLWLPARSDAPLIGAMLGSPAAALALSWAGALFDCTVVGFLLWRRTRAVAWVVVVAFHLVTWRLFPIIGVFPFVMIGMSTVFFDPDWPERVVRWVRSGRLAPGVLGAPDGTDAAERAENRGRRRVRTAAVVAAALWISLQVALPLRHALYPGDHRWSGEGYRFGWNVLLVEKAGDVTFRVTDPTTGAMWRQDPAALFTPQQVRTLSTEPELIRQAAHAVADDVERRGDARPDVRADAFVSLNGRPPERLIDPEVDLAAEPWRLGPQRWILPAPESPPPG